VHSSGAILQPVHAAYQHHCGGGACVLTLQVHDNIYIYSKKVKSKAVPLHAMEAHGGRGGVAPTHT
jgi:hypothetical protein